MYIFKHALASAFIMLTAFSTIADVYESPRKFKQLVVRMENAEAVEMKVTVIEQVDNCNYHALIANLEPIGGKETSDYIAYLNIISTRMACMDPGTHDEEFSHSFIVPGSYMTMLVPEHAHVDVNAIY